MHQNTDMLIFMSVHYPPMQAFHTQYLNIDLTQMDFIDIILDSIKTSVQLVWLQQTHPAYTSCEQDEHHSPTCSSSKPSGSAP